MLGLLLAATVVFERVQPLEVRTGVVHLCTVQAPLLDVPDPKGTAWRENRFARLYTLDFVLEAHGRDRSAREDRGALLLALRAETGDLTALDDKLRSLLQSLGPDAFGLPLAGIQEGSPGFLGLAEISTEPSWACSRRGGPGSNGSTTVYHRQTETGSDGQVRVLGTSSASSSNEEQARRVCGSFVQAAQGCAAEEIRTLPSPRELHEIRVEVEEASTLPREMRRQDILPLPEGVEVTKKRAPGTWSGDASSPDRARGTYTDREVEWSVTTAPASLPLELLARGAHVSRWTVRERERRLGFAPTDEVHTTAVRTVAFFPIAPASFPDDPPSPTLPVEFSAEQLRDDVAQALDAASQVDGALLEAALRGEPVMGPQWLRSEGWMTVVCRDDGTAWYGLPPTAARSSVTNSQIFCAAMERMLPSP